MFKTAATKIAHNSTIPALGGNQDLRPLQDLITAEKAVLISLQKLSVDYSKAAEALRTWGLSEGDDLGDVLSASTTILNHFSSSLSQYAAHGHAMRDQLKAIRTREESLEELKRRRRAVLKKADDAEKKLSKMNSEHKNLAMQTETLNRLREEIRTMDSDIMSEEAALGDFKRTATRMWMGLKFGGLLECSEKGTIAGEFGKMIISEISEEITQPGLPRSLYYGHSKTESFVAEAHRCINEVALSTVPSVGFRDRRQYASSGPAYPGPEGYSSPPWSPDDKPQPPPPIGRDSSDYPSVSRPYANSDVPGSPATSTGASFANQPYATQPYPPPQQSYHLPQGTGSTFSQTMPLQLSRSQSQNQNSQQTVDDFGVNTRIPAGGPIPDISNPGSGGRFATFPVKMRAPGSAGISPGYSLQDPPPSLNSRHELGPSFAASFAEAMDDKDREVRPVGSTAPLQFSRNVDISSSPGGALSLSHQNPAIINAPYPNIPTHSASSPLPPPPPGAAAPESNPWADAHEETAPLRVGLGPGTGLSRPTSQISENDDALLAYMTVADEESRIGDDSPSPTKNRTFLGPKGAAPPASVVGHRQELGLGHELGHDHETEEQQRISRHVRFGEVEDVEEELEKRSSLEKERQAAVAHPHGNVVTHGLSPLSEAVSVSTDSDTGDGTLKSGPTPPTLQVDEDEKALNAAAAREIGRELEALKVAGPPPSYAEPTGLVDQGIQPSTQNTGFDEYPNPYADSKEPPSPLAPPSVPFAKRTVSPHPYAELNPNLNTPTPAPVPIPQYSPAQAYAQSYQNPNPYGSPPKASQTMPVSPAQAYAQSFQPPSHAPELQAPAPNSNVPPRFQGLNSPPPESQVPPRFQATRGQSPGGSPNLGHTVPPRFQAGNNSASQATPPINASEQQHSHFSPPKLDGLGSGTETPYRTPPEYPGLRPLGTSSPYARSNVSLNSPGVGTPPAAGGGKISAAAFKRPRNASADAMALGDPFTSRKGLPGSPYPSATRDRDHSGSGGPAIITTLASPPANKAPDEAEEDDYDYIGAYVNNSNPNSPMKADFGSSVAGVASGGGKGSGGGGGYGEGRFATDLEGSGLR